MIYTKRKNIVYLYKHIPLSQESSELVFSNDKIIQYNTIINIIWKTIKDTADSDIKRRIKALSFELKDKNLHIKVRELMKHLMSDQVSNKLWLEHHV